MRIIFRNTEQSQTLNMGEMVKKIRSSERKKYTLNATRHLPHVKMNLLFKNEIILTHKHDKLTWAIRQALGSNSA